MFSLLFSLSYSSSTCSAANPPIVNGNPYVDYVSNQYIPNINLQQETPITVTEVPVATATMPVSQVSSFLVSKGYSNQANADKIQSRLKYLNSISSSFNDFDCNDMSSNFNKLADNQKNEDNFWNKIITRSATLIKATKTGNNVNLTVKKVSGTMRKRWAKVISKTESYPYTCTVKENKCGYKITNQYKCETVTKQQYKCTRTPTSSYSCSGFGTSRKCGFKTTYTNKCGYTPVTSQSCGYKPVQEYKCETVSTPKAYSKTYSLFKVTFTDSFNKTEVEDMFTSVQNQMKSKIYL